MSGSHLFKWMESLFVKMPRMKVHSFVGNYGEIVPPEECSQGVHPSVEFLLLFLPNGILTLRKVHQVFLHIKSISQSPFPTLFSYSYYACFYTPLRLVVFSIWRATGISHSVCLYLNPSSSASLFPPGSELFKPGAWAPSLIPHSALLDTSRQQPRPVHSTFSVSLKSVLFCTFTPHCCFLDQENHHFFPRLCHTHTWWALLLLTDTYTNLNRIVKVAKGTLESSLSGMFPCPAFSINHIYWVSTM